MRHKHRCGVLGDGPNGVETLDHEADIADGEHLIQEQHVRTNQNRGYGKAKSHLHA